jgi:arsenate reductase
MVRKNIIIVIFACALTKGAWGVMETILFLCPHNAARSIMAEAYYNHRVQQEGLPFLADSAGTEPSEQIWLTVIELPQREGIPLTSQIPRKVTRDDLLDAF